jgi:nicotinamidase-related amidase
MTDDGETRHAGHEWRPLVVPGQCALLIQELQRNVVGADSKLPELAAAATSVGLVEHAHHLARAARRAGIPVIHCTAENLPGGFGANRNARLFAAARKAGLENVPGSDSVKPIPELGPEEGDMVLPRYHGLSPMSGTNLDQLLRNAGITTVVVVGVSLNLAIPNLVFDAVNHGYQTVVVADAVAGVPPEYGQQVLAHTLSLIATVVTSDELGLAWEGR